MNSRFLFAIAMLFALAASGFGVPLTMIVKNSAYNEMAGAITTQQEAALKLAAKSVQEELISGNIRLAKMRLWSLVNDGSFVGFRITQGNDVIAEAGTRATDGLLTEVPIHFGSGPETPTWGTITFSRSDAGVKAAAKVLADHVALGSALLVALLLAFLGAIFTALWLSSRSLASVLSSLVQGNVVDRVGPRLFLVWAPLIRALRRTSAEAAELRNTVESGKANAAVARMTQMLAHDVRKPFSILRMGLGMLGNAKDPAAVKSVLSRLVPEIDKAVSSVDGLIADVMEIGSDSTRLIQEPTSPESLIEATLGEIFRIYPKANIAFSFDLKHDHPVDVHVQKVGRVFSNIVGNAVQAMKQNGDLWFKTRDLDGQIEICIGNSGSVIPTESQPKLFDAFFTSGKKGGTGLGLAIAQKVVSAHGGRIWCESSKSAAYPDGKVEFYFTLPAAAGQINSAVTDLPQHSSEIALSLPTVVDEARPMAGNVEKAELTLESDIVQVHQKLGRPLRVLIVDDEAVYRSAVVTYLSRTQDLEKAISLVQAAGVDDALDEIDRQKFDLVITDVDMGRASLDGFELVQAMRRKGAAAHICVHSNRIIAADHKTSIRAGADAFLPKPMTRAQLLKLVVQAAPATKSTLHPSEVDAHKMTRKGAVESENKRDEILVLDDNPFVLDAWQDLLRDDAVVHMLANLEDLKHRVAVDSTFVSRLSMAITDMNFDSSSGDGIAIGRLLKRLHPGLRVFLSSDQMVCDSDLNGAIDMVIGKDPVPLKALRIL